MRRCSWLDGAFVEDCNVQSEKAGAIWAQSEGLICPSPSACPFPSTPPMPHLPAGFTPVRAICSARRAPRTSPREDDAIRASVALSTLKPSADATRESTSDTRLSVTGGSDIDAAPAVSRADSRSWWREPDRATLVLAPRAASESLACPDGLWETSRMAGKREAQRDERRPLRAARAAASWV